MWLDFLVAVCSRCQQCSDSNCTVLSSHDTQWYRGTAIPRDLNTGIAIFGITILTEVSQISHNASANHHHHHVACPCRSVCRFHDFTPQFTVICSVPGRTQTQVLLFEVVLYCTQPCLSRTTARSSPVLRRVVDASVEGPCVVLIWIRMDNVAEESQTPSHDRLGDRRLSRADANLLVGDVSGEGNLQNVSKVPLIERLKSLAGLHCDIPQFWAIL